MVAVAVSLQLPQDMEAGGNPNLRKVMVVADPTRESAGALQYALSHVLAEQDELILLHVEHNFSWKKRFATLLRKPTSSSSNQTPSALFSSSYGGGSAAAGKVDFLDQMKHVCEVAQPNLQVRVLRVQMDAKNKAAVILSLSDMLGIDILVIGQRRSLSSAILK